MTHREYWAECLSIAAEECGLALTSEQLDALAESAEAGHDNYGMAFYSPPPSDRISSIESEWKKKLAAKEKELETYQHNAETAIKRALRVSPNDSVSIGEYGEVNLHGGRTTRIQ